MNKKIIMFFVFLFLVPLVYSDPICAGPDGESGDCCDIIDQFLSSQLFYGFNPETKIASVGFFAVNNSDPVDPNKAVQNAPILIYLEEPNSDGQVVTPAMAGPFYTDANGKIENLHIDDLYQSVRGADIDSNPYPKTFKFVYCPLNCSPEQCYNSFGINISECGHDCAIDLFPGYDLDSQVPASVFPTMISFNYTPPPQAGVPSFCLPLVFIFAFLGGSLYLTGRNPFSAFDLSSPRMRKHFRYAGRGRSFTVDATAIAGAIKRAANYVKAGGAAGEEKRTAKKKAALANFLGIGEGEGKDKESKSTATSTKGRVPMAGGAGAAQIRSGAGGAQEKGEGINAFEGVPILGSIITIKQLLKGEHKLSRLGEMRASLAKQAKIDGPVSFIVTDVLARMGGLRELFMIYDSSVDMVSVAKDDERISKRYTVAGLTQGSFGLAALLATNRLAKYASDDGHNGVRVGTQEKEVGKGEGKAKVTEVTKVEVSVSSSDIKIAPLTEEQQKAQAEGKKIEGTVTVTVAGVDHKLDLSNDTQREFFEAASAAKAQESANMEGAGDIRDRSSAAVNFWANVDALDGAALAHVAPPMNELSDDIMVVAADRQKKLTELSEDFVHGIRQSLEQQGGVHEKVADLVVTPENFGAEAEEITVDGVDYKVGIVATTGKDTDGDGLPDAKFKLVVLRDDDGVELTPNDEKLKGVHAKVLDMLGSDVPGGLSLGQHRTADPESGEVHDVNVTLGLTIDTENPQNTGYLTSNVAITNLDTGHTFERDGEGKINLTNYTPAEGEKITAPTGGLFDIAGQHQGSTSLGLSDQQGSRISAVMMSYANARGQLASLQQVSANMELLSQNFGKTPNKDLFKSAYGLVPLAPAVDVSVATVGKMVEGKGEEGHAGVIRSSQLIANEFGVRAAEFNAQAAIYNHNPSSQTVDLQSSQIASILYERTLRQKEELQKMVEDLREGGHERLVTETEGLLKRVEGQERELKVHVDTVSHSLTQIHASDQAKVRYYDAVTRVFNSPGAVGYKQKDLLRSIERVLIHSPPDLVNQTVALLSQNLEQGKGAALGQGVTKALKAAQEQYRVYQPIYAEYTKPYGGRDPNQELMQLHFQRMSVTDDPAKTQELDAQIDAVTKHMEKYRKPLEAARTKYDAAVQRFDYHYERAYGLQPEVFESRFIEHSTRRQITTQYGRFEKEYGKLRAVYQKAAEQARAQDKDHLARRYDGLAQGLTAKVEGHGLQHQETSIVHGAGLGTSYEYLGDFRSVYEAYLANPDSVSHKTHLVRAIQQLPPRLRKVFTPPEGPIGDFPTDKRGPTFAGVRKGPGHPKPV